MRAPLALVAAAGTALLAAAGCGPLGPEDDRPDGSGGNEAEAERSADAPAGPPVGERPGPAAPIDLDALEGSGCERLAALTELIGARTREPVALLRRLGFEAAGIGPPSAALRQLSRDGRDMITGGGFAPHLDDSTGGQARHFAAVAVAVTYAGAEATRVLSTRLRDDPPSSPDGRLTTEAIEFADGLLAGTIAARRAGSWIEDRICVQPPDMVGR